MRFTKQTWPGETLTTKSSVTGQPRGGRREAGRPRVRAGQRRRRGEGGGRGRRRRRLTAARRADPLRAATTSTSSVITIDRPEASNSLDLYHFRDLAEAWRRFRDDDDAWVAIITGVGGSFMAGADLKTYIPQITELQKQIASGEVDEIDGCRLRDGTDAVLRNAQALQADHRRGQRALRGRRHGDARRRRHPHRHARARSSA